MAYCLEFIFHAADTVRDWIFNINSCYLFEIFNKKNDKNISKK